MNESRLDRRWHQLVNGAVQATLESLTSGVPQIITQRITLRGTVISNLEQHRGGWRGGHAQAHRERPPGAEVDASGIPYFLVGHVGDGNFHFGYLIDPNNAQECATAEDLNHKLVNRALSLGGTCTGEHGIGLHKMDFLRAETGEGAVDMMRTIKRALDPNNIMNPGKIFSL